MENIDLIVVGNGFDLAHKLLTKYEHFYRFMQCSIETTNGRDFYDRFKREFEITNTIRLENRGLQFLSAKILSMKENFFVKYFTNYKKIYDTWNALEMELKDILIAIDYLFDNLTFENYQGNGAFQIDNINLNHGQYALYRKDIIGNWNNIQFNEMDNYTKGWIVLSGFPEYDRVLLDNFLKKFKEETTKKLFNDFKDFTYLFETYLNIFAEPEFLYFNFEYKFKRLISYNYTHTASKVYKIESDNCLYVHGQYEPLELVGKLLKDSIIFGIDDYSFKYDKLEAFTKSFQRMNLPNKTKILQFIEGLSSVCFYGHSFDLLDTASLKMICENMSKIYIFYYDEDAMMTIKQNLRKILSGKNIDEEIERENIIFRHTSEMHFIQEQKYTT